MCFMFNYNEQLSIELIYKLIKRLSPGYVFKSYRDLCDYLGIEPTGGSRKKAILAELSRCCSFERDGNKFIITKVFTFPLPKIDESFLKSLLYPSCGYLLLKFLSDEYIHYGASKPDCIKKKGKL